MAKSKYSTHVKPYLDDIEKWIREGQTEYCIYEKLGVSHNAWFTYKNNNNELKEAIKKGEQNLTLHIESMLYKRCSGYEIEETETHIEINGDKEKKRIKKTKKYISPSDTAIIFALKNKNPVKWADKTENIITYANKEEENINKWLETLSDSEIENKSFEELEEAYEKHIKEKDISKNNQKK